MSGFKDIGDRAEVYGGVGMKIHPKYNGVVFVYNNGQRGTDNCNAQLPFCSLWRRKNTFEVYYCGNPNCLIRIRRTWHFCPYCGQAINWGNEEETE